MSEVEDNEDDWVKHDGKGMPVSFDKTVTVMFKDGGYGKATAGFLNGDDPDESCWVWDGDAYSDIVAYRVVKP